MNSGAPGSPGVTASRAVKRLEKGGYLERKPNPANKISYLLSLTPKGKTVHNRVHAARRKFFAEATGKLSKSDLKELDRMIYEIASAAYCLMDED